MFPKLVLINRKVSTSPYGAALAGKYVVFHITDLSEGVLLLLWLAPHNRLLHTNRLLL